MEIPRDTALNYLDPFRFSRLGHFIGLHLRTDGRMQGAGSAAVACS